MMEFSSERLDYRLLEEQDRETFIALYQDPKVMRKIGPVFSREVASHLFDSSSRANSKTEYKQRIWAIFEKGTNDFCGIGMLKALGKEESEIGLILSRHQNGRAYPEESLGALTDFAFEKLMQRTVKAYFASDHIIIIRVLKKLGYSIISSSSVQPESSEGWVNACKFIKPS